ncbi:MAG: DNA mismatch repair protein MutS [Rhodobacteraceae bacterium]|nr:DNA mismatch repair protein MutS [Paracoccaceae bacterium]
MGPRKTRTLRPEERALWDKVTEKTTRLGPVHIPASESRMPAKTETNTAKHAAIPQFRIGARPATNPRKPKSENPLVAMDFKAFKKMKGGKITPEARIDLHGLTLAQAHPRLTDFILGSAYQGRRLVLVITGKGRGETGEGPIPTRQGALRHQVPHWLHSMPLKPFVLQVSEANRKHGGQGAIYVYLRRNRS